MATHGAVDRESEGLPPFRRALYQWIGIEPVRLDAAARDPLAEAALWRPWPDRAHADAERALNDVDDPDERLFGTAGVQRLRSQPRKRRHLGRACACLDGLRPRARQ